MYSVWRWVYDMAKSYVIPSYARYRSNLFTNLKLKQTEVITETMLRYLRAILPFASNNERVCIIDDLLFARCPDLKISIKDAI